MATFDPRRLLMFAVRVLEPIIGDYTCQHLRREENQKQERTESGHVDW